MLMIHGDFLMSLTDPTFRAPDRSREGLETIHRMQAAGGCAYRYEVEEQIRLVPHAERPGEMLRLWFPFPVACATQPESEIHLLGSSHPVRLTGTVHRTAFMEVPCEPGATYSVRFSFVNRAKYTDLSHHTPTGIPAGEGLTPEELERWTGEQYPHIRFTPLIDGLAEEIRGSETDPLRLARRVYDWICAHVQYSYVRDYLLIDNIPEFVRQTATVTAAPWRWHSLRCAVGWESPPSGSPAVPAHPTASEATTGACSTLRPMAGCTATRPTVSVRSGRATRSGASTISAILTRSGLSHRMSSSRRRNLPRCSVAWIHTTIGTARESMPTAYTTSFSVTAHERHVLSAEELPFDIRAAETKNAAAWRTVPIKTREETPMDAVFNGLNDRQRDTVTATEGYVRVIAGAGSGKTKLLVSRYAYLVLALGIDPANILCVTFTNKAAGEMKARIRAAIGRATTQV